MTLATGQVLEVTARIPGALLDLHYRHGLLVWLTALLRRFGREPSTRAAIVALASRMAQTLREHVESGAAKTCGAPCRAGDVSDRLAASTREDATLKKDVARMRREVAQMLPVEA